MSKQPLYPHVPKGKQQFVNVGDRVRYLIKGRVGHFRYGDWPEGVYLGDKEVDGTVTAYHPQEPEMMIHGEKFEAISAWAKVEWDNGANTAIDPENEGTSWARIR